MGCGMSRSTDEVSRITHATDMTPNHGGTLEARLDECQMRIDRLETTTKQDHATLEAIQRQLLPISHPHRNDPSPAVDPVSPASPISRDYVIVTNDTHRGNTNIEEIRAAFEGRILALETEKREQRDILERQEKQLQEVQAQRIAQEHAFQALQDRISKLEAAAAGGGSSISSSVVAESKDDNTGDEIGKAVPTKWETFAEAKGIQKQKRKEVVDDTETNTNASSAAAKSKEASNGATKLEATPAAVPATFKPLAPPTKIPSSEEEKLSRRIDFDVFLSHKRTDTADLARTLKTELAEVGQMNCFLDQDADFELGDLMSKVRGSATFIFILSEHILESEWCLLELREALLWGCNVILLTAHGAKWIVDGHTHDFPPAKLIRPEIAPAFANKAIEYNRNFHKASMDQLLQRMYGRPVHAALVPWTIPASSSEQDVNSTECSIDLSTLALELPPAHSIQTVSTLSRYTPFKEDDVFSCGLHEPFQVDRVDDGSHSKYLLRARSPTTSRPHGSLTWNTLVLDGGSNSIQAGVMELPSTRVIQLEDDGLLISKTYLPLLPGSFRGRPEVFVCLHSFQSPDNDDLSLGSIAEDCRRTSFFVTRQDHAGFDVEWKLNGPDVASSGHEVGKTFQLDRMKLSYLAWDPRINRAITKGQEFCMNPRNASDVGENIIRYGVEYSQPPIVFCGLVSWFSEMCGWKFDVSIEDVTTTTAKIKWRITFTHQLHPKWKKLMQENPSLPAPAPMPSNYSIAWIALPADPLTGGLVSK